MTHILPELPYALDALAPHISKETLEYHHGKHHKAYVDNLNKLIVDTDFADKTLLEIIQLSPKGGIFNNAAQVWNHTFYFHGLAPAGTTKISEDLENAIAEKWGSLEDFKKIFSEKAIANFGSGWTWLAVNEKNELEIINTDDAETLAIEQLVTPIFVCDVWEHAYYIDYRNARAKYLENFWHVVNWTKVEERYAI